MRWRNFSGWFKGGIIAGLIFVALNILIFISIFTSVGSFISGATYTFNLIAYPLATLLGTRRYPYFTFIMIAINFVLYFLVGALIGAMVSKLKTNKTKL